jgi:hypothetical protein
MRVQVASVVYWLVCLTLDPRFADSNPDEVMDFTGDKIRSTRSFGGYVRPEPHVVRFYGM